ncbi:hypothetical protein PUN28_007053 [Cardiocondyla obscurior]|uniref:Uncharacterized protein n=1 Tax=Cardiocondyla obscurior TaxID=286306 RepID=A0AAW2G123_9HYME
MHFVFSNAGRSDRRFSPAGVSAKTTIETTREPAKTHCDLSSEKKSPEEKKKKNLFTRAILRACRNASTTSERRTILSRLKCGLCARAK